MEQLLLKIMQECKLDKYDYKMLVEDVNNLRGGEWINYLAYEENLSDKTFMEFERMIKRPQLTKEQVKIIDDFINYSVDFMDNSLCLEDITKNDKDGFNVSFEWYSPLGEDILDDFDLPKNFTDSDISDIFNNKYINFDVDEHVRDLLNAKHNGYSDVPDASDLVDDAREILEIYRKLAAFCR